MKNTKILAYSCVLAVFVLSSLCSYATPLKIRVIEEMTSKPIEGAQIKFLSGQVHSMTDRFGETIVDTAYAVLIITHSNYISEEIVLSDDNVHKNTVKMRSNYVSQSIPVLYDTKTREHLTSSVSHISGDVMENMAATNRLNTLIGRLSGAGSIQTDGLIGKEEGNFKIRGQHTIGNRPGITVLVDGREIDYRMLDPYDIEDVVVLKDAAATAIYGLLGGNGVLLVNTKRGKQGRVKVNYNAQFTMQEPLKQPKFLDSYHYAVLYNEAMLNDNPLAKPYYTQADLNAYKYGNAQFAYPNVDWVDMFMKDETFNNRHNINLSGGGDVAKYYVSLGYLGAGDIFNTDSKLNTYETSSKVNTFNIHANVEVNINKNFYVAADIKAKRDERRAPGSYSTNFDQTIIGSLYSTPSNAFQPITYLDNLGGWTQGANPYGQLNYAGYSNAQSNFISTTIDMKYDLSDFVKGLSAFGYFGVNSSTDYITNRSKSFAYNVVNSKDYSLNSNATYHYQIGTDASIKGSGSYSSIARRFDHLFGLKYEGKSGKNIYDVSLMTDRQQQKEHLYSTLGKTFQGLKGKVSYRYNNRYLLDLAASYHGSNYFPKGDRYGFFPAASVGWLISNESFMSKKLVDMLKVRASVGKTGNDIGSAFATYYGYMSNYSTGSGAYFGSSLTGSTGMYQSRVGNPNITWETATKYNVGLDFSFLKGKIAGSVDYFNEENKDILLKNSVSVMYGAEVWMPEGVVSNRGAELELRWNESYKDVSWSLGTTISYAKNKIKNKNEEPRAYDWMVETGHPYGTLFGYVFDRYYTEDDDFSNLPDQSLLGEVQPGDLKYRDLNGDNIIDESDRTVIGKSPTPELYYGFDFHLNYKNFDLYALFQGIGDASYYKSGYTYWAFNSQKGNVMQHHLDRWTPGSGQDASYPRLSLTSTNNTQTSSYWVGNKRFLRLKQLELGYTLPNSLTKKMSISNLRFYVSAQNLLTWDKLKHLDPESDAMGYPNVRKFTCGLNVSF